MLAAERALDMLDDALIIVASDGRIEHSNRLAATLLKTGSLGLSAERGKLVANTAPMREQLMGSIQRACASLRSSGICVAGPGTTPERWTRMVVAPAGGYPERKEHRLALVWIINTQSYRSPSEAILTQLFNFSPAEARIAIGLLRGLSVAECAKRSGVSIATIRSQLHSMFNKTGLRRQSQLVALVAKIPVPSTE